MTPRSIIYPVPNIHEKDNQISFEFCRSAKLAVWELTGSITHPLPLTECDSRHPNLHGLPVANFIKVCNLFTSFLSLLTTKVS